MHKIIGASIFFWWWSLITVLISYAVWIIWRIVNIVLKLYFRLLSWGFFCNVLWKLSISRFQILSKWIDVNLSFLLLPIFQMLLFFPLWSVMGFLFILSFFYLWIGPYNLMGVERNGLWFFSLFNWLNFWSRLSLRFDCSQTLKVAFNVVNEFVFVFGMFVLFLFLLIFSLWNGVFRLIFTLFFGFPWNRKNRSL
jgi:hypothetical protein